MKLLKKNSDVIFQDSNEWAKMEPKDRIVSALNEFYPGTEIDFSSVVDIGIKNCKEMFCIIPHSYVKRDKSEELLFVASDEEKFMIKVMGWAPLEQITGLGSNNGTFLVNPLFFSDSPTQRKSIPKPHFHTYDTLHLEEKLDCVTRQLGGGKAASEILKSRIKILNEVADRTISKTSLNNFFYDNFSSLGSGFCCKEEFGQMAMAIYMCTYNETVPKSWWIDAESKFFLEKLKTCNEDSMIDFLDKWLKKKEVQFERIEAIMYELPSRYDKAYSVYLLPAVQNISILGSADCFVQNGEIFALPEDIFKSFVFSEFKTSLQKITDVPFRFKESPAVLCEFGGLDKLFNVVSIPKPKVPVVNNVPDIEDLMKYAPPCLFENLNDLYTAKRWNHNQRLGAGVFLDIGYSKEDAQKHISLHLEKSSDSKTQIEQRISEVESVLKMGAKTKNSEGGGFASRSCPKMIYERDIKEKTCPFKKYDKEKVDELLKKMNVDPETRRKVKESKENELGRCKLMASERMRQKAAVKNWASKGPRVEVSHAGFTTPYNYVHYMVSESKKIEQKK